ncbi:purine-nucleoside phosphorylase [Antrihabitans sp. YC2-6]|uniref:purine-nucleoside phosphorylase n=1 Tax=Antrihabitans sp. YC2-6 TaxID=2799498 RepID=UPI0018F49E7D|nr:purine-nucleoside phosphorylase [Antrihabitans sp. YC2-6]MBJ8347368.1 purine-nucleoside phosphorylase [Antrihabitans sp. YC2-6]
MEATQAAASIAERSGIAEHRVAIVLGSGWQQAAAQLGEPTAAIPMTELAGFAPPAAAGHVGTVLSVDVAGTPVLVMMGRSHLYEGFPVGQIVHPIRTACAAGAKTVILTNAAGGIRDGLRVGEPVLVSDHINLTGRSPLLGAEFVDLVDAYAPELREIAKGVDPALTEGVYAGVAGPQYETPAEIRMLRTIGADLVGMSTVHETIAARSLGARVLAISLVTNLAAGVTGAPLNHAEVLAEGQAAAARIGRLLRDVVAEL